MTDWKELKTLQEVAQAQKDGLEIECYRDGRWEKWVEVFWDSCWKFRARPRKKTKQVVLREALVTTSEGCCFKEEMNQERYDDYKCVGFKVTWIGPESIVEVPEND